MADDSRWTMLIDGAEVNAAETRPVVNPATGETIASVPEARAADVNRALVAARRWISY